MSMQIVQVKVWVQVIYYQKKLKFNSTLVHDLLTYLLPYKSF